MKQLITFSTGKNSEGSGGKGAAGVRVLTFNGDGVQRATTWASYGGPAVSLPGDYTLCLRFNIWVFRLLTAVLYLLPNDDPDEDRKMPDIEA